MIREHRSVLSNLIRKEETMSNNYKRENIQLRLKFLRGDWKEWREVKALSKNRQNDVGALVNVLNDERKKIRNKSFEFLDNQYELVKGRIAYYKLVKDYDELHRKHTKAMKLVDGIRAVVKGEI